MELGEQVHGQQRLGIHLVSLIALATRGAAGLLERLRDLAPSTEEARATVTRERQYFQTNRDRVRYPEFRTPGLPIGSSAVESSAKHVIQQRLK